MINYFGYIYIVYVMELDKFYVGQSTNLKDLYHFENYVGSGKYITEFLLKKHYNYKKYVLDYALTKEELDKKEIEWIEYYNTRSNGLNIHKGGSFK